MSLPNNHKTRRRMAQLRRMCQRITRVLAEKRAQGGHAPIVLQILEAERTALEWALSVLEGKNDGKDCDA